MTLLTSAIFYAQEKIEFVDYYEIMEEIAGFKEKKEHSKMMEYLDKVNPNDSLYESSLVTKSYYLLEMENYDEAVKTANEGLAIPNGEERYSFLLNKGVAYLRSKKFEEALILYDKAVEEFPKNHVLFYNRAIVKERLNKTEEAVSDYKQSIILNPFYADSHLQLGKICYLEKKTGQAMMALNMYLLLNPDGEKSFSILNSVNTSVSKQNDATPKGTIISKDDETFEDIDLIIDSRIALNANYEIKNKINIALTKQNHALFEKLEEYEGNEGFWDRKYVPFYKWVFENSHFDNFTYTISYSIENPEFKKIVNKHTSDIKTFIDHAYLKWKEIMSQDNQQMFEGKKQKVSHVFEGYTLQAVGISKKEKKVGNWEMYNEYGKLTGRGKFDEEGRRTGAWEWYDNQGRISDKESYVNGKVQGEYTSFYSNGNVKVKCFYKEGSLDGEYKTYNKKGALIEKKIFSKDKLEGTYLSYHPIGEASKNYVVNYTEGNPKGELEQYHANGKLHKKRNYKDGKINGVEKIYFSNGALNAEYNYVDGLSNGAYTKYYKNGTKSEVGNTSNGYYDGDWKLYHPDGTLMNEFTYNEGELNGVYKEYDIDGKLYYDFVYKNDEFIEYKYYNKSENIIKEAKKKKGEFYYQGYSPLGDLETEGMYDVKGGKEGEWKYYENGVLIDKGTYTDNLLQGKYFEFHKSGQKKSIIEYKNDSLSGYYAGYHKNGNMSRQGWHKKGKSYGTWISYYGNGKIKEKNFYHKGKLHGIQEFYSVEGKLASKSKYEYGDLVSEIFYKPNGDVLQEIHYEFKEKNRTISVKQFNGKTYAETDYLYGVKHGKYTRYNYEGKKIIEGKYFNGKFHGSWKWYYDNGQISLQGQYDHGDPAGEWKEFFEDGQVNEIYTYAFGKLDGVAKVYHENGTLTRTTDYKNGNIHGERRFFSPSSKLQLVRYYHNDKIIGYSYNDTDGKLKEMIPLENYTGVIKAYFDNGKPSIEMEFKNGFFVNELKAYYYSGQLERQIAYKDGDNHGAYAFYYADGTLKKEMNYIHGNLHGKYTKYYPNGKRKEERNYISDSRSGATKYFDENEKLVEERFYFNDIQEK